MRLRLVPILACGLLGMTVAGAGVASARQPAEPLQPTIIGGGTVSTAPWAAAVYRNGSFTCSGTIVAPTWVLTAKHCVGSGMSVRVGDAFRAEGERARVVRSTTSPKGDVALLKLSRPVDTDFAPLADADPPVGIVTTIVGWGRTSLDGPAAAQLRMAQVRLTATGCRDAYGGRALCSIGIDGVAWKGDSGGPQFHEGQQVGVASTADGESRQRYAGVAANRGWIREVAGV